MITDHGLLDYWIARSKIARSKITRITLKK